MANGVIYFTTNAGSLYALDATNGTVLSYGQSGASYLGGPAVSDGTVYVNAFSLGITAFVPQGGATAVQPQAPKPRSLHPDFSLAVSR